MPVTCLLIFAPFSSLALFSYCRTCNRARTHELADAEYLQLSLVKQSNCWRWWFNCRSWLRFSSFETRVLSGFFTLPVLLKRFISLLIIGSFPLLSLETVVLMINNSPYRSGLLIVYCYLFCWQKPKIKCVFIWIMQHIYLLIRIYKEMKVILFKTYTYTHKAYAINNVIFSILPAKDAIYFQKAVVFYALLIMYCLLCHLNLFGRWFTTKWNVFLMLFLYYFVIFTTGVCEYGHMWRCKHNLIL